MPIYEFQCLKCDHIYETYASIRDRNNDTNCPVCYSNKCFRLISSSHIKVGDEWSGLRNKTGCKGFELVAPDGYRAPMYNKYKTD